MPKERPRPTSQKKAAGKARGKEAASRGVKAAAKAAKAAKTSGLSMLGARTPNQLGEPGHVGRRTGRLPAQTLLHSEWRHGDQSS